MITNYSHNNNQNDDLFNNWNLAKFVCFVHSFIHFVVVVHVPAQQQMTQINALLMKFLAGWRRKCTHIENIIITDFDCFDRCVCVCVVSICMFLFRLVSKSVALSTMLCDTLTISMAFRPLNNIKRTMK